MHRAERADGLVSALADLLAQPAGDPLGPEVVAVPTRGVERWLSQRLSHRLGRGVGEDGVCANVEFPFPGTLVARATAAASGLEPDEDPWPPERSVWPLLDVIDQNRDQPFLAPLAAHLRDSSPRDRQDRVRLRRFTTARHLADLFDRYATHRPGMITAWASGRSWFEQDPSSNEAWQSELWRRLRERIGAPSPAERFDAVRARLVDDPDLVDLPSRLSVFGLTRLPASHVRVLDVLAVGRDVHLYLLHPSKVLWDQVATDGFEGRGDSRRRNDPTTGVPSHPLLRSWGRDAREMQLVLAPVAARDGGHHQVPSGPGSLLGTVQGDIRANRRPPGLGPFPDGGDPRPVLAPDDGSLTVHSCHGRTRQVEVMRDAVLHQLAEDPSLELRDVIIMCPDIESFAPLIQAAFGAGDAAVGGGLDLPLLPVRLADRAIRQTNPLLAVASHLLDLAAARVTASQVLDLVSMEPVGRRFQIDEDDLGRLSEWVAEAGIRWGIDQQRASRGLEGLSANTWNTGLDRLLLGVALTEEDCRLFGDILPLEDVAGSEAELVGRVAELVARLGRSLDALSGPATIGGWAEALGGATERMAVAAPSESWQHEQLQRVLDEVVAEARTGALGGGAGRTLDLGEVRSLFAHRLAGRPTRANFRTGDLTICTLVPMRSVPHRVVGLLGLDDDVFPRHSGEDGDDLLLTDPHVGDRDPRTEDRQLLLDALLAAEERLIITYNGRDPRTNQPRPPAVPVSELLDVIDRTVRVGDQPGGSGPVKARQRVLVEHPLQSFDPGNFTTGRLKSDTPWSFDPLNLAAAESVRDERLPRSGFLTRPLAPLGGTALELSDLIRFVEHPAKAFLRERLGLYLRQVEGLRDSVPLELDGLEKWGVGDRLLAARLAGVAPEAARRAEEARGLLPPGVLGQALLDEVGPSVELLLGRLEAEPGADAASESYEVNVELPDGRYLTGTVSGVRGSTIVACTYSSLAPKHRLAAWVRFLALSASRPDLEVGAVSVGRGRRSASRGQLLVRSGLHPLPGPAEARRKWALDRLSNLADLYDRGMAEPLPLYCRTSAAWVEAQRSGREPGPEAEHRWKTGFNGPPGEDQDLEHVQLLGPDCGFLTLLEEKTRPHDPSPGDRPTASRFELYSHLLWDDLLDHPEHLQDDL